MRNVGVVSFFFVISFLILCPVCTFGETFTLSDDAIMALDYDYDPNNSSAVITRVTDVAGPGVRFDILFKETNGVNLQPNIERMSCDFGGRGILKGIDISRFNTFALKFTLLSARGISKPDLFGPVIVGSITDMGDSWGFNPKTIAINDSHYPVEVNSITKTEGAEKIGVVGFTCYIPYWWYDYHPSPWDTKGAKISLLVAPAPDAALVFARQVDKCTLTAGATKGKSSISASGKIDADAGDLLGDNDGEIEVALGSNVMPDPYIINFPIDNKRFLNNGKFTCSVTQMGVKKTFKLDLKTHKFSFSIKNIDLTALSCPLYFRTDINNNPAETLLDETIVNGPKKPIPIYFLMGVKDSIRVDKISVRYGSKTSTDRLYVKGGFSVYDTDVSMADYDFTANLANQKFIIPARTFKANKAGDRFTCSNVKLSDGSIASADFNFKTCTFTLTIRNASIEADPDAATKFSIEFADFNASAEVLLP